MAQDEIGSVDRWRVGQTLPDIEIQLVEDDGVTPRVITNWCGWCSFQYIDDDEPHVTRPAEITDASIGIARVTLTGAEAYKVGVLEFQFTFMNPNARQRQSMEWYRMTLPIMRRIVL